jgi:4-hydroxy-2-oxoglutarate aldolase
MSPHNDAPSPAGSFTHGFNMAFRPTASSGLRNSSSNTSSIYSESPLNDSLSSSFSSSSLDVDDHMSRPLVPGVYVPTVCFFDPVTEDLDKETIATHAVRLAQAGVTGLTTQGSNGEAVHLTHAERQAVTATTRSALNSAGFSHMPNPSEKQSYTVERHMKLVVTTRWSSRLPIMHPSSPRRPRASLSSSMRWQTNHQFPS